MPAGQAWCGQCFAPATRTAAAPAVPGRAWTPPAASALPPPAPRRTRWGKTPTTFGPVGRLAATFAVLVPFAVMVVGGIADPFAWGGAVIWLVIIVPWAMRDIWRAGQVASR